MGKKTFGLLVTFILGIVAIVLVILACMATSASAMPLYQQETCNEGNGWVKVDGLSGTSFTYTAPEGFAVAGTCYKASTTVIYDTIAPPQQIVTVVSEVYNQNEQVQELSHASFLLVVLDPTSTPTPTATPTPIVPTEVTKTPTTPPKATPTSTDVPAGGEGPSSDPNSIGIFIIIVLVVLGVFALIII